MWFIWLTTEKNVVIHSLLIFIPAFSSILIEAHMAQIFGGSIILLTNDTDRVVIINNSTVVIGNHSGGNIAASTQTGQQLDKQDEELLRIFHSLSVRLQIEFFQCALDLEERNLKRA